jgi:hypothetical protein
MSRPVMWNEWKKYGESQNGINYERMVGSRIPVLIVVRFNKSEIDSSKWNAGISTFHPGAGEYILFDEVFSSLEQAEEKTWEKAQEIVRNINE